MCSYENIDSEEEEEEEEEEERPKPIAARYLRGPPVKPRAQPEQVWGHSLGSLNLFYTKGYKTTIYTWLNIYDVL